MISKSQNYLLHFCFLRKTANSCQWFWTYPLFAFRCVSCLRLRYEIFALASAWDEHENRFEHEREIHPSRVWLFEMAVHCKNISRKKMKVGTIWKFCSEKGVIQTFKHSKLNSPSISINNDNTQSKQSVTLPNFSHIVGFIRFVKEKTSSAHNLLHGNWCFGRDINEPFVGDTCR